MTRKRSPSEQTQRVLLELAEGHAGWRHGYDLCQRTGLKAGSVYPILMRLADRGMLESCWEQDPPGGRPPRHMYRLTKAGVKEAAQIASEQAAGGRLREALA